MFLFAALVLATLPGMDPGLEGTDTAEYEPDKVRSEEVRFRNGNTLLAGTLYLPAKSGRNPGVALVLGSGAQDRRYGGVGVALGRHFASQGIACLTWDRPGVGKSGGDYQLQTFRDRAEEALAAVHYLQARPEIARDRVGIWGHSQGGMVAPLAVSLSRDVGFVIEVSGWQGPAWKQDAVRVEAELRAAGFSPADMAAATAFTRERMALIRGSAPFEVLARRQQAVEHHAWFAHVHRCDRALFYSARKQVGADSTPWWETVHCPVLVLYGDKDTSTGSPQALVEIIRRGLKKAGNQRITERIFPEADHSLCKVLTGGRQRSPAQRAGSQPDFVDGYLEIMVTWVRKLDPAAP